MQAEDIHQLITQFFKEMDCPILTNDPAYLVVQLTNEVDQQIMNRPYYWQYIHSTGSTPSPAQLTFITHPEKVDGKIQGELMHLGAAHFQQISQAIQRLGAYVHVYERTEDQGTLTPWLNINYKVSYCCHQKKEHLYSLGMNLMTGEVLQHFYESIASRTFDEDRNELCTYLPPIITPVKAAERLDDLLQQSIQLEDHQWAREAEEQLKKEALVLHYFFEHVDVKPAQYYTEKEALEAQYSPYIQMEVVNGGVFYLQTYPTLSSD